MKRRALALVVSTIAVVAGCLGEPEYNKRLEGTLELMKYEKTLDTYLNPADPSGFREKEVFLRVPQPLARDPQVMLQLPAPGSFDLAASYSGTPAAEEGQPASLPIRVHVLSRWKKPPKAPTKKGEAPPPAAAPRGPFEQDVRTLLATNYGNNEVQSSKSTQVNARGRAYRRVVFNAGNGNAVRAYFYDAGNHNVAIVVDVPAALANAKAAVSGENYMLETLAVGNAAKAAFDGRTEAAGTGGAAF